MGEKNYLTELSSLLSPVDLAVVSASLWQDAIIWKAIQDPVLIKKVAHNGSGLSGWSPAGLALAVLDTGILVEQLLSDQAVEFADDLKQHALNTYDGLMTGASLAANLENAALVTIALRERNRLTLSWKALFDPKNAYLPMGSAELLRTSLACLYGLVSDPDVLLRALIDGFDKQLGLEWACHCILTNPQPENRMREIMTGLLLDLTVEQQIAWLRLLQLKGWASLATGLSESLVNTGQKVEEAQSLSVLNMPTAQMPQRMQQLQQTAALHIHANRQGDARLLLETAQMLAWHNLASIQIQLANLDGNGQAEEPELWSGALNSPWLQADLSFANSEKPWDARLTEGVQPSSGFMMLRMARLTAAHGDRTNARKLAHSGVATLPSLDFSNAEVWGQTGINWNPADLISELVELELLEDAAAVARASLESRRMDKVLLKNASLVFERLGNLDEAIEAARLLCLNTIEKLDDVRRLAGLYERKSDWDNALLMRRQVISLDKEPTTEDTLCLANAALQSGATGGTVEICCKVLEQDPDQGGAHALLGLAFLQQGNQVEAIEHLSRATLLSPDEPRAWLALAEVQSEKGDLLGAMGTLRAAVLAAPNSAELNFALAKACLESSQPSDALPFLWEAARLDASHAEVAWKLARTLHNLGHRIEARQVIDQARWRWPEHAMTAGIDAEMLLDTGDLERAIAPLEIALLDPNPQPEWYLMHARALLGLTPGAALFNVRRPDDDRLMRAKKSLEKSISTAQVEMEPHILLAEVQLSLGAAQDAYDQYKSLVENPNLTQTEWRWRVQAGMGRAALASGEIETALVLLREAAQNHAEDTHIQQTLAEAYVQAKLPQDAIRIARQALVLDTDNVENLGWFIDIMTRLGKSEETLTALETVTRLVPEQAPFWNKLARVQIQRGDVDSARQTLSTLLAVPEIGMDEYRSCARSYLMMGETRAALECLKKGKSVSGVSPLDVQYAAAWLLHRLNLNEAALALAQDYAGREDSPAEAKIMLSDVLSWIDKSEEALVCLQDVLTDCAVAESEIDADAQLAEDDLLPAGWRNNVLTLAKIHARIALLNWNRGELSEALTHANISLENMPENAELQVLVTELARACGSEMTNNLQNDCSVQADLREGEITVWEQALAVMRIEQALENKEDALAARFFEQHISIIPDEPHLLAIQARLLHRMGDVTGALSALEESLKIGRCAVPGEGNILQAKDLSESIWGLYQNSAALYQAEAALDMEQWGSAVKAFEEYTKSHATEPRGFIRAARASVICAEQQRLCAALRCEQHTLSAYSHIEPLATWFKDNIAKVEQITGGLIDVSIWKVRGQAVFEPSLRQAPAVAKLAPTSENAAALLALLRNTKNAANAVRIAHHYPENPMLLVQLALCYREVDVLKGLEAARKAVEMNANYPLHYAALALLEQDAGNDVAALNALEIALNARQDEPGWHAWSGELYQNLGEERRSLACWEDALALRPDSSEYALVVGKKNMEFGNPERAIEVLEHASEVCVENSDVWVALAQAFRMVGRLDEALNCTNQASKISPEDPASYLTSGEIALQMGDPDAALEYAHTALQSTPDHPAAVLFISKVLVQKGQLAEGLTVLEKSMPVLHGSLPVMLERANLIHRLYGAQVALPVYLELAQMFPQESAVLGMLAQTQTECGDLKAAERTAYSAHHINPDHPQLNFLLGRLQHASGQLDQAIHFLSEAIRQSPAEIEPYLELGQAYLERREHLKALQTYQQAIKVSGRDHRPYYRAALVLRDCKDYVAAETMLRRAADFAPDDLNIRRQLGAVVALNLVHNTQEVNSPL